MWACGSLCTYFQKCRGQSSMLCVLLRSSLLLTLRQGLLWTEPSMLARLAGPGDLKVFWDLPHNAGVTDTTQPWQVFYLRAVDPNPGPDVCIAMFSPTEHLLGPSVCFSSCLFFGCPSTLDCHTVSEDPPPSPDRVTCSLLLTWVWGVNLQVWVPEHHQSESKNS